MISYPFPPLGAAGAIRPYRFAKHLPKFSWNPIVLTINERKDAPRDYSLLGSLPKEVALYRTRTIDPYLFYKASLQKGGNRRINGKIDKTPRGKDADSVYRNFLGSVKKGIRRSILSLITTPDHQIFWFPFAVWSGASLIFRHNIDVLLTTSPPHSAHLVGLVLKKIFRKPWIADFRDPWVENFTLRNGLPSWQYTLERHLESKVLAGADKVIANTATNRRSLINRYPQLDILKFVSIPNGFETLAIDRRTRFEKFTITHLGIFYPMVGPYFFFDALNKWLEDNGQQLRRKVQVLLIGEQNDETRKLIKRLSLGDVVRFIQRLPQKDALELTCSSDMLLVSLGFDQRNAGWIPMKLYDYLYCKKPILAFLPRGEAANIIRETSSGYVVGSENFEETINILNKGYRKKFGSHVGKTDCEFNTEQIGRFNVEELTKCLATLMTEISR